MRVSILAALASATVAQAVTVSYDRGYDDADRSLGVVACSDGENGLITRYGWQTQGDVSNFPYIGGSFRVAGWNDPDCGNCYSITYKGRTVNITAVDVAVQGFNIGFEAMDELTNGQAEQLGRVDATTKRVALKWCGL